MNDVQADNPDHLGTKLARVLGGEAAALNTLLAKLRPYLHCLVREQLASAERYQDHGSDLGQERSVRFYIDLGLSQGSVGSVPRPRSKCTSFPHKAHTSRHACYHEVAPKIS